MVILIFQMYKLSDSFVTIHTIMLQKRKFHYFHALVVKKQKYVINLPIIAETIKTTANYNKKPLQANYEKFRKT